VQPTQPAQTSGTVESLSPKAAVDAGRIVSDYAGALLMVSGSGGAGSGFLCTMGGKTYAFTNIHIIADIPGFRMTSLQSEQVGVGASGLAVDHDIARMEVNGSVKKSFEVVENFEATVKIGDPVLVLGNAQGARVVRPMEGKVLGIGPNLVEVDAPLVPGNSGSPIVHVPSGKVIGVATYRIIRKEQDGIDSVGSGGSGSPRGRNPQDSGRYTTEIRRFGYRIDSVKNWQPVNWPLFYAQAAQTARIDELSDDFMRLINSDRFVDGRYKTPAVQQAVSNLTQKLAQKQGRRYVSPGEAREVYIAFYNELRNCIRGDINGFNLGGAYDYFRRDVQEQAAFRDAVNADLSKAVNAMAFK